MAETIYAQLAGIGSYLPGEPISNEALIQAKGLESSDEWIVTRTGIAARHHAPEGVTSSMLAKRQVAALWRMPVLLLPILI
jgi:3-oxoacyl-[acyl-carrier-protein] synthase-3